MRKSTLKSLQPQTKSLFRFKNADTKPKFFGIQTTVDDTVDTSTTTLSTTTQY